MLVSDLMELLRRQDPGRNVFIQVDTEMDVFMPAQALVEKFLYFDEECQSFQEVLSDPQIERTRAIKRLVIV